MKIDLFSITAHTGCGGTPVNTIESAIAGLAAGADIVEVDVRTTLDGTAVLSHDDVVPTDSGAHLSIEKSEYAQLAAGGKPPVQLEPLLDEVLSRGGRVNLDLKDDRSTGSTISLLTVRNAERVVITGCGFSRAKLMLSLMPGLEVFLNTDEPLRDYREAHAAGCCGLNIDYTVYRDELPGVIHGKSMVLSVWTVPADKHRYFIDAGADNITTRDVEPLAELRRRH